MVAPRIDGPDWRDLGWNYRFLHRTGSVWHDAFVDARVKGAEHLNRAGGFVIASNHTSWWDPILLIACSGRVIHWLAKKSAFGNPVGKWFLGRGGCIPVDRDAKRNPEALNAARAALRAGRVIGVFPEGTRNHGDELLTFKGGAARLALAAGVPVVPVGVLTDRFWPRARKTPRRSETVYVNVGEPLTLHGDAADAEATRAATKEIKGAVEALLAEAGHARDAGAEWTRVRDLKHGIPGIPRDIGLSAPRAP